MKTTIPAITAFLLATFISLTSLHSQISVNSTTGYTVNITILPTSIVTSSPNCQFGYNYNLLVDYAVTFTGTNIPSSLYTLQGTIGCGPSNHFYNLPDNGGVGQITTQSNVWNNGNNCASATIASMNCRVARVQISGPGISNRTITFNTSTPLPVTLADFNAVAMKDKVKITWSTVTESNNDFFTAERSLDGAIWTTVKTIKGAGNSTELLSYSCFDENPVNGTAYYRLKQSDFDGKFTYSETKSVKTASSKSISLFPVPNTGNTINFKGIGEAQAWTMMIRNTMGVSVYVTALSATTVNLPSLAKGLYTITLSNRVTGENTSLRYVKI